MLAVKLASTIYYARRNSSRAKCAEKSAGPSGDKNSSEKNISKTITSFVQNRLSCRLTIILTDYKSKQRPSSKTDTIPTL